MRKLALVGAFALAACSGSDEASEPVVEETVAVADPLAVDGGPIAGSYEIVGPDGTANTVLVNADGTAVYTDDKGEVTNATYTGGSATEAFCVTYEGEAEAACYDEVIANGKWTATNQSDPGDVWTVSRVETE